MADDAGKINLALKDVPGAEILVISQFTLYGDAAKGRRPSFVAAAPPAVAIPLYEHFLRAVSASDVPVKNGEFGADMMVQIQNDGPVTIILETPAKS